MGGTPNFLEGCLSENFNGTLKRYQSGCGAVLMISNPKRYHPKVYIVIKMNSFNIYILFFTLDFASSSINYTYY